MKLKALSKYDGDVDTRYGDCIMLYDDTSLIVYDCGHSRHAEEVEDFLTGKRSAIASQSPGIVSASKSCNFERNKSSNISLSLSFISLLLNTIHESCVAIIVWHA